MLRAYAKYLRQVGTTFSKDYIERALRANVEIARLLVRLFEARFDPDVTVARPTGRGGAGRQELTDALLEEIRAALDAVASLDHDRILRSFLTLVQATVRTNAFQRDDDGRPKPYLSFKLDPRGVPDLPQPRPLHEIFVYSPAGGGGAPALRRRRPGRPALERPAGGLPHRDPRPGQGADREERRHRARPAPRAGSSPSTCPTRPWTATPGWPRASRATGP